MATPQTHKALSEAGVTPMWDTPVTAAFIDIPPATLDQWAYLGKGPPYYKVGRHRRYRQREVEAWLDANRHGGGDAV